MIKKPTAVLEEALTALKSRIQGVWDAPELMAVGPLSTSTTDDCLRIISEAEAGAEKLRADAATSDIVASQWRVSTLHGNVRAVLAGDRTVLTANEALGDDIERIISCVNACRGIPTEELAGAQFVPADDETPLFELVPGGWENVQ